MPRPLTITEKSIVPEIAACYIILDEVNTLTLPVLAITAKFTGAIAMPLQNNQIISQLIENAIDNQNKTGTDVIQQTVDTLKNTRLGLFQNEIDYGLVIENMQKGTSRVNVLGFMGHSFNLVELRLFDEQNHDYTHWGVLHWLKTDIEKLEHASTFESEHRIEFYFVFAIRNSQQVLNQNQLDIALDIALNPTGDQNPNVGNANFYTVLRTIEHLNSEKWEIEFLHRNGVSFLLGKLKPTRLLLPQEG